MHIYLPKSLSTGRPCHLSTPYDMQMQMVYALGTIRPIIDYNPKSFLPQSFLLCDWLSRIQKMTKQALVTLICIWKPCQSTTLFWNQEEVHRTLGLNITKREALVIFVDYLGRNFLIDNLVKYSRLSWPFSPASPLNTAWNIIDLCIRIQYIYSSSFPPTHPCAAASFALSTSEELILIDRLLPPARVSPLGFAVSRWRQKEKKKQARE